MRQIFLLLTAALTLSVAYGQTPFHMRYGSPFHDQANKVIQTQDGNFLIVGHTFGFGSAGNALMMKVNESGAKWKWGNISKLYSCQYQYYCTII